MLDVYRPEKRRVQLIDINPYGKVTDSLFFDWSELNPEEFDNFDKVKLTMSLLLYFDICFFLIRGLNFDTYRKIVEFNRKVIERMPSLLT